MMEPDQIQAILMKENNDFFKKFGSVSDYIAYRTYATAIMNTVHTLMHKPHALAGCADAIGKDRPYILTSVNRQLVTGLGHKSYEYTKVSTEYALKSAFELSLGAICWETFELDDTTYYFIWVSADSTKERWDNLEKTIGEIGTFITSLEPPDETPDYEGHFDEEEEPDLTLH